MEIVLGIIGSAFFSWLITHIYYKKSLDEQSKEAGKEISDLLQSFQDQHQEQNNRVLYQ